MKKNGMTLVEIIISIALISIVLLFLFSLLMSVKDINSESEVNSSYLINKALIIKNIEEDFTKASSIGVDTCNVSDIYSTYNSNILDIKNRANGCFKFTYNKRDSLGVDYSEDAYLGIYYYTLKNSYVISYINGDTKATRMLENFDKNNVSSGVLKKEFDSSRIEIKGTFPNQFVIINIPIIGPDGKDYGINISYYGNLTSNI